MIAHFTTDDLDETLTGIKEVAASGNPRAEIIISALQSGQLMFSAERKAVYIQDGMSLKLARADLTRYPRFGLACAAYAGRSDC